MTQKLTILNKASPTWDLIFNYLTFLGLQILNVKLIIIISIWHFYSQFINLKLVNVLQQKGTIWIHKARTNNVTDRVLVWTWQRIIRYLQWVRVCAFIRHPLQMTVYVPCDWWSCTNTGVLGILLKPAWLFSHFSEFKAWPNVNYVNYVNMLWQWLRQKGWVWTWILLS